MAREIKFRGRNILNNDWMYGDLIHDDEHCRVYVYPRDAGPLELKHRVDAETIGQFTGLHDKNGKEIYEGDIIRAYGSKGDEIKHIVEYSDKEAMFCTKLIGAEMLGGSITQRWLNEFEFEVIGNIYDNPELLKED